MFARLAVTARWLWRTAIGASTPMPARSARMDSPRRAISPIAASQAASGFKAAAAKVASASIVQDSITGANSRIAARYSSALLACAPWVMVRKATAAVIVAVRVWIMRFMVFCSWSPLANRVSASGVKALFRA